MNIKWSEEDKRIFELNDVYTVKKFVGKNKRKKVKNRGPLEFEYYAIYADSQAEAVQWCRENSEFPDQWDFHRPYKTPWPRPKHLSRIKGGRPVELDESGLTQYMYLRNIIRSQNS